MNKDTQDSSTILEAFLAAQPAYMKAVAKRAAKDGAYRAALKRDAGKTIEDAAAKTLYQFYQVAPTMLRKYAPQCFLAASLQCLYTEEDLPKAVPLAAAYQYMPEEGRDSFLRRLVMVLDTPYEEERMFALQLYRLVRFAKAKGVVVDCTALLADLISWKGRSNRIKRKWMELALSSRS